MNLPVEPGKLPVENYPSFYRKESVEFYLQTIKGKTPENGNYARISTDGLGPTISPDTLLTSKRIRVVGTAEAGVA